MRCHSNYDLMLVGNKINPPNMKSIVLLIKQSNKLTLGSAGFLIIARLKEARSPTARAIRKNLITRLTFVIHTTTAVVCANR